VAGGLYAAGSGLIPGSDRSQWEATSLSLPNSLLDIPRQPEIEKSDQVKGLAGQLSAIGGQTALGVYSRTAADAPSIVVIAGRSPSPMSEAAQKVNWDAFLKAMQEKGGNDQLTDRDAGRLGGRAACGTLSSGPVLCLSIDSAALVAVVGSGDVPGGVEALATVRENVEHRS
jgi:secreted trypsin-like serine protease